MSLQQQVEDALARWRAAERDLAEEHEGSAAHYVARARGERARAEYQELAERAKEHHEPGEAPPEPDAA